MQYEFRAVAFLLPAERKGIMPNFARQQSRPSAVKLTVDAIANWINRYRHTLNRHDEFEKISPDQVMAMAKDIGITPTQLRELASKRPGAADLLQKLFVALNIDPKKLDQIDVRIARDMHWLCATCNNKARCKHELAAGTAAENFREYCPNAIDLGALFNPDVEHHGDPKPTMPRKP